MALLGSRSDSVIALLGGPGSGTRTELVIDLGRKLWTRLPESRLAGDGEKAVFNRMLINGNARLMLFMAFVWALAWKYGLAESLMGGEQVGNRGSGASPLAAFGTGLR